MDETKGREPVTDDEGIDARGDGTSRGDFLKWGTVAMGGLYVGPKITSFAVQGRLGGAGSIPTAPVPTPVPVSPIPPVYPGTGGAANLTPAQRRKLKSRDR